MKRNKVLTKPTPVSDLTSLENLYNGFGSSQEDKVQKQHVRRWRQLKHQLN